MDLTGPLSAIFDLGLPVWIRFPIGFVLLLLGAELLVRAAARLAAAAGISSLVIGLTVVAFGTSAPELAVSVGSSLTGQPDVAVGNIVGSNIMNILLILGLSATIAPLVVQTQLVRLDVPLMIAASVAVMLFSLDNQITRVEGIILVAALVAYLVFVFWLARRRPESDGPAAAKEVEDLIGGGKASRITGGIAGQVALLVLGIGMLMLGSRWLVDGAVITARWMGVSELIIGLTVVAVGTSLPEVATSVWASIKGERDIAVGNVVGSNLFNLLCVLGLTAVLPPAGVEVAQAAVQFDLPVMLATAVVCFPIFFTGGRIDRWEGLLLLLYFFAYIGFLILDTQQHAALGPYSWILGAFFIPLTVLGLGGALFLSIRNRLKRRARLRELRTIRADTRSRELSEDESPDPTRT